MEFRHKTQCIYRLNSSFIAGDASLSLYEVNQRQIVDGFIWPARRLAVNYQLFHKHSEKALSDIQST